MHEPDDIADTRNIAWLHADAIAPTPAFYPRRAPLTL